MSTSPARPQERVQEEMLTQLGSSPSAERRVHIGVDRKGPEGVRGRPVAATGHHHEPIDGRQSSTWYCQESSLAHLHQRKLSSVFITVGDSETPVTFESQRVFVTVGVPRHPQLFSAITFESQRAVRRSPASAEVTRQVEVSTLGSHQVAVPGQRRTQNPR